jgi:hypothetical protein
MLRAIITVVIVLLVVVWIVQSPASAGDTVHNWVAGVGTFFSHLTH